MEPERGRLGARLHDDGSCTFRTWAPHAHRVELLTWPAGRRPEMPLTGLHAQAPPRSGGLAPNVTRMAPADEFGVHEACLPGMEAAMRYALCLDGGPALPDPSSRWQPDGVHGASAIASSRFPWTDGAWRGVPQSSLVLYEVHVGTRTHGGRFESLVPLLPRLADLGVTGIELMPIAEFPGCRNWGYDGVFPSAAQSTYGGPDGLRALVDACHAQGLAVILDVVYNHLGPEGNVAHLFGPFYTKRFRTPWGDAINFDDEHSDGVRDFFLDAARWYLDDCHLDGLRLDAVHEICDWSAHPFLQDVSELGDAIEARRARSICLIAESDRNDRRLVEPRERNGLGLDAKWNEDFHHALHAALTGERWGYHSEYGRMDQVLATWRDGYFFTGQRSPSRRKRHGSCTSGLPGDRFVAFIQNHDQVGNRPLGERLASLVPFEALKLAAASVLLSPYMPMLFMGEEHGETAPFPYFTSHQDPDLVEAVRAGRQEMTSTFGPDIHAPDPQAESTFRSAMVAEAPEPGSPGERLWEWHRELLRLRREVVAMAGGRAGLTAWLDGPSTLVVRRSAAGQECMLVLHHAAAPSALTSLPAAGAPWRLALDSSDARWGGTGSFAPATLSADSQPGPSSLPARATGAWREGAAQRGGAPQDGGTGWFPSVGRPSLPLEIPGWAVLLYVTP